MAQLKAGLVLLACASLVAAQYGPGIGNPANAAETNPFYNSEGNNRNSPLSALLASHRGIVIAHGVLASLAFVIFFPIGAIVMRLGSFKGLWLVHAAIQAFAFVLFIAAFGIGIYMSSHAGLSSGAHPVIGIVLFILLLFQPVLGLLHHFMFKKHSRRTVWSYGHIWLGRIGITLGMINGGLGLRLAQKLQVFAPSTGAIIAYGVIAGVMWVVYVACAVLGGLQSRKTQKNNVSKETYAAPEPEKQEQRYA
ncbi:hypothetical protein AMS68_003925 [Peltaster fructicola]|uniref:Cytochrome b561 domain-containing protein n=1 Tax=Peltaster fructicola TaxID=286661 RepID=A0A6H0XUX0_9PEZI|nr:hypothetical protein AMS68_003925 [Peltaster fructicola]